MYETFYGLAGNAFRLTPDCRFKFPHASYVEAADRLLQATKRGEGFALLTGAPGSGKTTLVNDLATRLESDGYCVGKVVNSQVDADDLLQLIGFAFGLQADTFSKAGLLTQLEDQLASKGRKRRPAILIVDEAQGLTAAALEQLRLLCSLTGDHGSLVQILLAGQERLWERLRRPECSQIQQLVVVTCRLNSLSAAETRAYIRQALQLADWKGDPEIGADALGLIHERTGGIPRLINLTLGRLLLHGSLIAAHRLDAQDVEAVLSQLGNDHPDLLAGTSPGLFPSERAPAQALLPLDAGAVRESEHPKEQSRREPLALATPTAKRPAALQHLKSWLGRAAKRDWKQVLSGLLKGSRWRARSSLSSLAKKRDAAAKYLRSWRTRMARWNWRGALSGLSKGQRRRAGFSLAALAGTGDAARRHLKSGLERLPRWNWELVLPGLLALAASTYVIFHAGFEDDRHLKLESPETVRAAAPSTVAPQRIDPPVTKEGETALGPVASAMQVAPGTEAVAPAAASAETGMQASEPREDGPAIVGLDRAPTEPGEVLAEMPAIGAQTIFEIDDAVFSRGLQELGRDQPTRDQVQEQALDQEEIAALLEKAEQALSENRLTVPSEDNAYAYYQAILAGDPENAEALAGVERIVQRYRQLAWHRLNRGDRRRARLYASRGLGISPQDQELRTIKRRAGKGRSRSRARAARHAPDSSRVPEPLSRIERWFRSGNTNESPFLDN